MEENKINFKHFFENFGSIMEDAKVNMGDFAEVLFAVGLLHYTLKHSVSDDDIFKTITEIPSLPYENTFNHDNYDVALHLEGKKGVANLIGGNFNTLSPEHQDQIKSIVSKISANIPKLKTIHKVDAFISSVKQLPDSNKFAIVIKSIGSKMSQEKESKADVSMEVIAKENIKIPSDIKKINYSLKYRIDKNESKIVEASVFTLILRLGNAFKLPMTSGLEGMRTLPYQVSPSTGSKWLHELFYSNEKYKALSLQENHLFNFIRKYFTTNVGDRETVLKHFCLEFNNEMIVKEKHQPAFSVVLYDFLEKEIFGQDLADIVRIDATGIKDIDVEAYNKIRNNYLVDFSTRPVKSKDLIFKFEAIAKDGTSFLLFWIENHRDGTVQVHIGGDLLK